MDHQFNLFSFEHMRPRRKVPISAESVRKARQMMSDGDAKGAAQILREIREKLEQFERRMKRS